MTQGTRPRPIAGAVPVRPGLEQELVLLPAGETPVRWRRCSRARRVSLRIDPRAGTVVVTLPQRAARGTGLALLHRHSDWIANRLAALPQQVVLDDGTVILLDGQPHRVRHAPDARRGVWVGDGEIHVSGERSFLPRRLLDFLRAEAGRRLTALAAEIGTGAMLLPRRVTIKDTSTRWGSCSSGSVVMFSWRLVMAPADVQHYVVAHELAHLRHLDHGQAFWALVDQITPYRLTAEAWLRDHGAALLRTG